MLEMLSSTEIIIIVLNVLLIVITLWDILTRRSSDNRTKLMQFLIVVFIPVFGLLFYWLVFRKRTSQ